MSRFYMVYKYFVTCIFFCLGPIIIYLFLCSPIIETLELSKKVKSCRYERACINVYFKIKTFEEHIFIDPKYEVLIFTLFCLNWNINHLATGNTMYRIYITLNEVLKKHAFNNVQPFIWPWSIDHYSYLTLYLEIYLL